MTANECNVCNQMQSGVRSVQPVRWDRGGVAKYRKALFLRSNGHSLEVSRLPERFCFRWDISAWNCGTNAGRCARSGGIRHRNAEDVSSGLGRWEGY